MDRRQELARSGYRLNASRFGAKAMRGPAENKAAEPDATDAARELAESEGVELAGLEGSGQGGRITVDDVRAALEG